MVRELGFARGKAEVFWGWVGLRGLRGPRGLRGASPVRCTCEATSNRALHWSFAVEKRSDRQVFNCASARRSTCEAIKLYAPHKSFAPVRRALSPLRPLGPLSPNNPRLFSAQPLCEALTQCPGHLPQPLGKPQRPAPQPRHKASAAGSDERQSSRGDGLLHFSALRQHASKRETP